MSIFSAKSTITSHDDTYPYISPSKFAGRLNGKVILITGASRGIGRVSALSFAAAGAHVACLARRKDDVDAVVEQIKSTHPGADAVAVVGDVADPATPRRVVADVEAKLGPIDILLNCAGITRFGTLVCEEEFEDWWKVIEINLRGPVAMVHAVLPGMIARKTGILISVTSTSGSQDIPFNTAYATSKAALIKFHQDLAVEVGDKGLLGFAVHPGTVATDLGKNSGAVNMKSVEAEPRMQEMLNSFGEYKGQTPELAADTFAALCADPDAQLLSGKYIDSQQDLGEVIADVKKGKEGRIAKERLYHLKVDEL